MIIRNFSLVGKAIIVRNGKFLLLRKSKNELSKTKINKHVKWDLPGGAIQFFEKNTEGLAREIKEETGLTCSIIKPIGVYDAIKSHIHMTVLTYLCEDTSSKEVSLSYEHDEFIWLSPEEIKNFDMPIWLKRYFETAILEYSNMKLIEEIKGKTNN